MGKGKPHIEFMPLDMEDGWEVPPGYPEGMEQKVLTSDLDEEKNKFVDESAKSEELGRKIADLIGADYVEADDE